MLTSMFQLARPMLFALAPEQAHEATLKGLEAGIYPRDNGPASPRLAVTIAGLAFANPLGIAAGFDKDARVPDAMLGLGFGHVEIGSVTPRPQPGNPRPRLFRLPGDGAVINRMGFNSAGHEAVAARLVARKRQGGIIAVNLGANRDSTDKAADFAAGVERLGEFASFLTINVSSPNTPGLRDLQMPEALSRLLESLADARARLAARTGARPAMVVKLAPEIAEDDLPGVVARLLSGGADGIAVSNTTLARDGLTDASLARQSGGLSGRPLFRRSTRMLARVYQLSQGKVPLIGIGGVDSGAAAAAKIAAGASLVQLYTGMIYEGPGIAALLNRHLAVELDRRGLSSIGALRGVEAERWSRASL